MTGVQTCALPILCRWLVPFVEARNQFELNYLRKLLQITKGNVTHAARMAGRNRTEFYKLLSRNELDANDFKE